MYIFEQTRNENCELKIVKSLKLESLTRFYTLEVFVTLQFLKIIAENESFNVVSTQYHRIRMHHSKSMLVFPRSNVIELSKTHFSRMKWKETSVKDPIDVRNLP